MESARFRRFCWLALGYVVAVILWGAYVRATGSGAGCGSHWPTCNGAIVPRAPSTKTLIELTHRVTSGLSALVVLAQLIWVRRALPKGHPARSASIAAGVFMLVEVLIGAGIVLLKYVADDQSVARAVWMALHLVNTLLLVGSMTLTAHYVGGAPRFRMRASPMLAGLAWLALLGTLFVSASGAVAALGDTLFPAKDLGTALAADLSPTAHALVRLRVVHPFAAVLVAFAILAVRFAIGSQRPSPAVQRWGMWLRILVVAQICAGFGNLMLLAPTWMQLVHLLLANALWVTLVLFVASGFAVQPDVVDDEAIVDEEPAGARTA